jgi:hypothetical protein
MRTITASFLFPLAVAFAGDPNIKPTSPDISELHIRIQQRFLDRTDFGMNRILPAARKGVHKFRPENDGERRITTKLESQGYEVALYLLGRAALPDQPPPFIAIDPRRTLPQGPAFITNVARTIDLPSESDLLAAGRDGFAKLEKDDAYDIREFGWTIAMRPLRPNETCGECHGSPINRTTLQTLDLRTYALRKTENPLGVALYVYRKRN